MQIKKLSDIDDKKLGAGYRGLIEYVVQCDIDQDAMISILLKVAMEIAISEDYDRDEVLSVVANVYDMERIMHPTSDELH
jgi:hypothetical protein